MCTKESEKLNKNADYYIGLDMGTSSAGWAVSDSEYNLIRRKGKDLWGVRQFEEAKTAAERRGFRVARRRKQRQQVRNRLLSEEFQNEITKIDSGFLKLDRLRSSVKLSCNQLFLDVFKVVDHTLPGLVSTAD